MTYSREALWESAAQTERARLVFIEGRTREILNGLWKNAVLKMPSTCCVIKCNSRSHDRHGLKLTNGLSFFRFPAWKNRSSSHVSEVTKRRRMAWIAAVRRPKLTFDHTPPHMMVCSKHFHKGKLISANVM